MKKCRYCPNPGLVKIKRKFLCKEHFNNYYFKRIKKVLKNIDLKGKRILIALSGGKDSVSIIHALNFLSKHYKFEITALFLNLGIGDFSKESLNISKELTQKYEIPLIVFDLKEEFGFSIMDISKKFKRVCSYCGNIKRYLINKIAYENNFDYIITGHNMDDEIIFLQQNILSNSLGYLKRYSYFYTPTIREKKLIGRIKPQFFLSENDNKNYCIANELNFVKEACVFSEKSSHKILEEGIALMNTKMDYSYNFLNFFLKINQYLPDEAIDFKFCKNCGYPTTNFEICKFCRIVEQVTDEEH